MLMMRKYLFILSVAIVLTSIANAKEYGNYDTQNILSISETPEGGKKHSLDVAYLDRVLGDLYFHAKNYPPQFDTPEDQQRAIRDIKILSGMLDVLINIPTPNPEILIRAGVLNSLGYNLNISGSTEKTNSIYQRLLALAPSDQNGNYRYGTFLASAGKAKEALPYLEKAFALGKIDAAYTLGVTYITLGDKDNALRSLEAYKQKSTIGNNVDELISAIREGKIEFKKLSE